MPRISRTVIPGIPHHITQRGNRRQFVFFSDADRLTYLALLNEQSGKFGMSLLAYCLMPNHVHLIAVPQRGDSLSLVLGTVHSKYSKIVNKRFEWKGHLWQYRFFSCPLDIRYLQEATRYVEMNPVRAGLAEEPELYSWSSAKARIFNEPDAYLSRESEWNKHLYSGEVWRKFLSVAKPREDSELRHCAQKGIPCGSRQFVERLEQETGQVFHVRKAGRPPNREKDF